MVLIQDGEGEGESYLSRVCLADEAGSIGGGVAVLGETEALYVGVDGYAGGACGGCGGRGREGVVGDGGCLLLHGRVPEHVFRRRGAVGDAVGGSFTRWTVTSTTAGLSGWCCLWTTALVG